MTIDSLNELAARYKQHLKSIPFAEFLEASCHVAGTQSVYELQFSLYTLTGVEEFWYVGRTKNPRTRLAGHKSNFRNCRVTTFVGVSELYTPELLDVTGVKLSLEVVYGGLSVKDAKEAEKGHSAFLRSLHGDAVLTRPHGSGER